MKRKRSIPLAADLAQPYVMAIADQLADDPMPLRLIGQRFKVVVDYDAPARRVPLADSRYERIFLSRRYQLVVRAAEWSLHRNSNRVVDEVLPFLRNPCL